MSITLETLHQATKEQVLGHIFKHLYKQGEAAISSCGGSCMYRTEEGLKCAAGCLITEDYYDNNVRADSKGDNGWAYFENSIFDEVAAIFNETAEHPIPGEMVRLITSTQHAHDGIADSKTPDEFRERLVSRFADIAKMHSVGFIPMQLIAEVQDGN